MASADTLRALALALPEAEEKPHHERTSFRVKGKIFATLSEAEGQAVLKLDVPHQQALVESEPGTFLLVGWAHQGWTGVRLAAIDDDLLSDLLAKAWRGVAPKRIVRAFDADRA